MFTRVLNGIRLLQIFRERANWKLIRRSRKHLRDFILFRSGVRRASLFSALWHWFYMLKGLDVLVWRLETFGILFLPDATPQDKERLNQNL